ncbi:hypothetical protein GCM10009117_01090 [Gangjinia marincola]|uniref:Nuclear transport factor 2 family protein n=1 Tax=Gangjinia marincola TaxID=578463 RepID=A0ABP3XNX7_9FLAO
MTNAKELVKSFYESDFIGSIDTLAKYLHPELELYWNSSEGFNKLTYSDISNLVKEMGKSYESIRSNISHLIQEGNKVTIRYTDYVRMIENPDEEVALGHYIAIWEIEENRMRKGFQISQPYSDEPENIRSFLP